MTSLLQRTFAGIAVAIVLLALGWGLWLVGSPASERLRKFDERRVEDLRVVQSEINNIVYGIGRPDIPRVLTSPIPATLEEVAANARYQRPNIQDPETQEPYGYRVINTTHYELCATFHYLRDDQYDVQWNHPAGHACFTIDVTGEEGTKTVPRGAPAVPAPID